ncbi:MAG: anti-sigma F factor [Oscillospiraceae bacterium]
MKILNEVKLTFLSKSANEGFARVSAAAFAAQLDPTVEEISDIKTAVSEAVTNCIVHAYRDEIGKIAMTLRLIDSDTVYIKISDKGCGIEDIGQAMEPMFTTSPGDERAGLGFAVMESFMNTLKVRSKVGKGTTVIMTKKIVAR